MRENKTHLLKNEIINVSILIIRTSQDYGNLLLGYEKLGNIYFS